MVYVVGLGPGNVDYIIPKAIETIEKVQVVLGFKRALEVINFIKVKQIEISSIKQVIDIINSDEYENIAVVASGDPCFFGISDYIKKNSIKEIKVIPGISSFQYLMANLNKMWQGAYLGSLHGREDNFLENTKKYNLSVWLTDNKNTPAYLCKILLENGIHCHIYIGEKLSYEDENIVSGKPEQFVHMEFNNLSILVVEKN